MRFFLLLLCCAASAVGGIGDTEQAVMKSKGDASYISVHLMRGARALMYKDPDEVVTVFTFLEGKCIAETHIVTRERAGKILSKYGEWELMKNSESAPQWKNKTANLFARYNRDDGNLTILQADKIKEAVDLTDETVKKLSWLLDR